jgi:hypothetical protein
VASHGRLTAAEPALTIGATRPRIGRHVAGAGSRQFDLGTIHDLPTVLKIEALPASRIEASLACRCRAKMSRVQPQGPLEPQDLLAIRRVEHGNPEATYEA